MKKVAILISGRGSNMQALCNATHGQNPAYEVCKVISNRPDADGLSWASANGFDTAALDHKAFDSKADFETALHDELMASQADYVCLAGFMRLLSAAFVKRWRGKILNIHPSLLPSFEGLTPQQRAIDAGTRISGCTVHFVSEKMDGGPIIAQSAVPVLPDDTEDTLSARILKAEHDIYSKALSAVCLSHVSWSGEPVAQISSDLTQPLYGFRES